MILVGIGESAHDSSMCAYINGKVKYAKYERCCGLKHAYAPVYWYFDKLKEWGIDLDDIDALAHTAPGEYYFDQNRIQVSDPRLRPPYDGSMYLDNTNLYRGWHGFIPKSKHVYMLDHHYAHLHSSTKSTSKSKGVILDGCGSNGKNELICNSDFVEFSRDGYHVQGSTLTTLGAMLGLKPDLPSTCPTDVIGKIMGLQAYGKPIQSIVDQFSAYTNGQTDHFVNWLFSLNIEASANNQEFLDVVASAFRVGYHGTKIVFDKIGKEHELIYSGGNALNVNWNRWLLDEGYKLHIEPHVYDGGLSIGCVKFLCEKFDQEVSFDGFPYLQDDQAPDTIPTDETINHVASLLAEGKIVGWYQGHGELGPRALGNRSILMNPSVKNGKDIINSKVKHREWWRPFGASVKQDKASEYFDLDNSPYMLYASQVLKSGLDAITHKDGSCRHQTVTPEQNETFYRLLDAFEKKTGLSVLLNTSLNLGGNPIAGTMAEAIELFQTTEMDALCLGNHLLLK